MNCTELQGFGTIIELDHQLTTSSLEDVRIFYFHTEESGTGKFMIEVDKVDITVSQQLVCDSNGEKLLNCTPEFSDLANIIMHEKHC